MTRTSDSGLAGTDVVAAGETLRRRFVRALRPTPINAVLAEDRQGHPLTRSSVASLALLVVGAGLSFAAQLVIARIIGPDSYGIYAYVLACVTLLGYLSTLGFHVSLLRLVPAYMVKEERTLACGVIRYAQRATAGTAISIALIGLCTIWALRDTLRPELALTFLLGMMAAPFLALHLVGAAIVRAFGGIIASLAPERIVRDGLALALVATVFWGNLYPQDATLAMGSMLISSISVLVLVQISLHRLRPPELGDVTPAYTAEDWWRPALPLTVMMIADNLMSRSAVIALGLTGSTRDAGIFAAAFSMATVTALPRMAVAISFAPTVSTLFALGDQAGLQSVSTRAAWLSFLGTACAAVPLLLLAEPLLSWFGRDFVAGAPIVRVLVLGQLLAAACGPQQHLITMTGNERAGAAILAVCAGLNFGGCMLAIGWIGMTGAAFVTTLTLVGWNVAMAVFIHRNLHLTPAVVAFLKSLAGRIGVAGYGF